MLVDLSFAQMFCPFGLHFVLVFRLFLSFRLYFPPIDLPVFSASVFHPSLLQQISLQSDLIVYLSSQKKYTGTVGLRLMEKLLYSRSFIYVGIVPIDWPGSLWKQSRLVDLYGQFYSLVTGVTIGFQKSILMSNEPGIFVATSGLL